MVCVCVCVCVRACGGGGMLLLQCLCFVAMVIHVSYCNGISSNNSYRIKAMRQVGGTKGYVGEWIME